MGRPNPTRSKQHPARAASLTRRADLAFSALIRSRGYCQAAGHDELACRGVLQCAHIVTRKNYAVRWDTLNALCLCEAHHVHYSFRGRDLEWPALIQKLYTAADYLELVRRSRLEWDGSRIIVQPLEH